MENQFLFQRRNERALLWQGIIFFLGLAFIDGNAVVSVFISSMGGSLALAGLVSAIRVAPSTLMQLFVGIQAGRMKNLPRAITALMAVFYSLPLVMALVLAGGLANGPALLVFLVLYALLWAGDGCVLIGWYDLFGRLADPKRRGMILGWQQLFGGALALLGSAAVGFVLRQEGLALTARYAILFGLAGLFLGGSAIAMGFVRDVPHRQLNQDNPIKHIASFPALFRENGAFRRMTAVQALQGVAVSALPLLILFSKQEFSFSLATTALLIPMQTAGSLAGGLVWGLVSRRLGNLWIIRLDQANIALVMALAITAALTGWAWLAFPLAFLSGITFAAWMGFPNYVIDITTEQNRPQFLVMSSLVNLPFTFLPALMGSIAQSFGFLPVFAICAAAAAASLAVSSSLAKNSGKNSVIA